MVAMKIARTFTIDYNLAVELQKKPNQSRIVERSIRRYLAADEDYSLSEIPTKQLMAALHAREDTPRHIKIIIYDQLTSS